MGETSARVDCEEEMIAMDVKSERAGFEERMAVRDRAKDDAPPGRSLNAEFILIISLLVSS